MDEAVEDCIQRGILAEFLSKNRAEVVKVSIYENEKKKVKRMFREECMKIGMEEGVKRGIEQGIEQARKIFHLYLSGRSEEDIAKETGEDIELIRKVLNG